MNDTLEASRKTPHEDSKFESLKDVEFAGDNPPEEDETPEKDSPGEIALDEKVARLREPFEIDEAVRIEHEERLSQWQADSDARASELESLREEEERLEDEEETISGKMKDQQGKFSTRLRTKLGMRDKTVTELASRRRDVQRRLYEIGMRKEDIDSKEQSAKIDLDYLYREPEYEESPEPLTVEQKEQFLDPEALSELSLEEYIALWRRLNPFYASHVTRQGIRDHNSMFYHSAGMGEFQSGFTEMLERGKAIHSGGEVHYGITEGFTEEDVSHALEIAMPSYEDDIDERLEAGDDPEDVANWFVDHLPMNYTWASAEPWSDLNAIHFGRNTCLDETYGAEKGNEVFYIFPIDVIASQNRFGGHIGSSFSTAQVKSERKWNDMFVWSETGRIPLDAGIVFLPKSTLVSPETGSVYETVESINERGEIKREPFLDEEIVQTLIKTIETLEQEDFYNPEKGSIYDVLYDRERREALKERLKNEFHLSDEIIDHIFEGNIELIRSPKDYAENDMFASSARADGFDLDSLSQEEKFRLSVSYGLERRSLGFKKAEKTIPA